jgi:Flp pilus assembly protein TadD
VEVAAETLPALATAATAATADSPEALASQPVKATDAAADLARTSRRRWIVGAAALAVPTLAYVVWNSPLVSPHSQLDALNTAQLIDAKFLFESAKKLARDGKWPEAIWRLQRAAELDGGNGENFAIQAYCLLQQNNIAGGSDLGRSAIEANYSNSAVLNNYGYALLKDRRFDLAASNLRAALKMAPNEAAIHHNFAILMLAEEHPREAVRHIRRALELHPADSMELHRNAALIFAEVAAPGSPLEQDAIQHLETAIRAGLDRRTLASGKGNLERILKLAKEKDASNLGTRDPSASSVRLIYPSANHSALPSVALLKP